MPRGGSGNFNRRCYVSGKEGCFSTKHTIEEQRASRQRFNYDQALHGDRYENRDFAAFLVDYEGDEFGEEMTMKVISSMRTKIMKTATMIKSRTNSLERRTVRQTAPARPMGTATPSASTVSIRASQMPRFPQFSRIWLKQKICQPGMTTSYVQALCSKC